MTNFTSRGGSFSELAGRQVTSDVGCKSICRLEQREASFLCGGALLLLSSAGHFAAGIQASQLEELVVTARRVDMFSQAVSASAGSFIALTAGEDSSFRIVAGLLRSSPVAICSLSGVVIAARQYLRKTNVVPKYSRGTPERANASRPLVGAWRALPYRIGYDLALFSYFAYFPDPMNGDQFEQADDRRIFGGEWRYEQGSDPRAKSFNSIRVCSGIAMTALPSASIRPYRASASTPSVRIP